MTDTERSFGVALLSILHIILGVLVFSGGTILLATEFTLPELLQHVRPFGVRSSTLGMALVIFALIDFILAYGLWTRRKWAWSVSLAFAVLGIILTVLSLFARPGFGEILALILYLVAIYYLMQPSVQIQFGRGTGLGSPQPASGRSISDQTHTRISLAAGFCAGYRPRLA